MKATLTFNLDDPDDVMAHKRCIESTKMAIALFDIIYNADRYVTTIEQYKQKINEATEGINLNELINWYLY